MAGNGGLTVETEIAGEGGPGVETGRGIVEDGGPEVLGKGMVGLDHETETEKETEKETETKTETEKEGENPEVETERRGGLGCLPVLNQRRLKT